MVAAIEEAILEKLRLLPSDKQNEVLDFIEFLSRKALAIQPLQSSYGLLADLNISITKEEIDEARREMWANFPREHFYTEEDKQ